MEVEVEPVEEGFFFEPGDLAFGVVAGGFLEFVEEVGEVLRCFWGLEVLDGLAVADGLGGGAVLCEAEWRRDSTSWRKPFSIMSSQRLLMRW